MSRQLSHLEGWERWASETQMYRCPPRPTLGALALPPYLCQGYPDVPDDCSSLPTSTPASDPDSVFSELSAASLKASLDLSRPGRALQGLCSHPTWRTLGSRPPVPACLPPATPARLPSFLGTLPPQVSVPGMFFSKTDMWLALGSWLKCPLSMRSSWPPFIFILNGPL